MGNTSCTCSQPVEDNADKPTPREKAPDNNISDVVKNEVLEQQSARNNKNNIEVNAATGNA